MIHKCLSPIWGAYNADDLRKAADANDAWDKSQVSIYKRKTGFSDTVLLHMMADNSQKTVALQMQRPSRDYIVITEASNVKGNLGQIEVSDQLSNGFKVAYTGSATAATINYIVIGGYMK